MLLIFIRTVLLYIIVLVVLRIMGKSELSKTSPFQMVVIFMIAELAAIPIESPSVSLISGVTAIFTLLFLQVIISVLSLKSERFKILVNGKPSVVIEGGEVNAKEMKKLRMSINDLMEELRIKNSPSISDVNFAVMETNGSLSVIPKKEKQSVTIQDLNLSSAEEQMPLIVLSDGVLYKENLQKMGYDKTIFDNNLHGIGISDYENVFLAFCDEKRKLHIYCEGNNGKATEVIICEPL